MGDEKHCERVSDAVGGTPLVRLRRSVPGFGGEVFAKLEFVNPMGSVKDRIARYMVERALAEGRLRAGDTVIEASSGNTAMGLAMMAIEHDLRCVMVVRRQTSREKLAALAALGVELVLVDGDLPPEHPDSYNRKARDLAAAIPRAFFPDQHNNRANNEAHYATTGPELWRQMDGRIDWFPADIGLYYELAATWHEDATLAGSGTILAAGGGAEAPVAAPSAADPADFLGRR